MLFFCSYAIVHSQPRFGVIRVGSEKHITLKRCSKAASPLMEFNYSETSSADELITTHGLDTKLLFGKVHVEVVEEQTMAMKEDEQAFDFDARKLAEWEMAAACLHRKKILQQSEVRQVRIGTVFYFARSKIARRRSRVPGHIGIPMSSLWRHCDKGSTRSARAWHLRRRNR